MTAIEGVVSADTLALHPEAVDVLKYNIAKLLLRPLHELEGLAVGNEIMVNAEAPDAYDPDAKLDPRIEWMEHVHEDGEVHVAGYLSDVHVASNVPGWPTWPDGN